MQRPPTGFCPNTDGLSTPLPPTREWHASITPHLRNHLVAKLIKGFLPLPNSAAIDDQTIEDVVTYASQVEKDMFELAPTKEAYFHMLAEKIYKTQKELEEKSAAAAIDGLDDDAGDGDGDGDGARENCPKCHANN